MKLKLRGIALTAALLCAMAAVPWSAGAEETAAPSAEPVATATAPSDQAVAQDGDLKDYDVYEQENTMPQATDSITLGAEAASGNAGGVEVRSDEKFGKAVVIKGGSTVSLKVNVPKDAKYNLTVVFGNLDVTTEEYVFDLKIDGEIPFEEAKLLTLGVLWDDDGGIRQLSNGDQVSAAQKHVDGYAERYIIDSNGIVVRPFEFALSAGEHTVELVNRGRDMLIGQVKLVPPEQIRPYSEISAEYGQYKKYDGEQIVIEAEDSLYRSDYALTAKADNGSASISPYSAKQALVNYIGGTTWKDPGQEIAWKFDAPEDGLYKIGFNFKQAAVTNGNVYRWLKIDGKTPFEEAMSVGFSYKTSWQFKSFADAQGNDYLIYLTKGPHTLSLDVSLSDIAEVFDRLETIVAQIGDLYLDMAMITGDTVDANRDYQLHVQIPDFVETLNSSYDLITALHSEIGNGLQVNGELAGALNNMARILDDMRNNLYDAHLYISTYYSSYQTLSAWLYDIKNMTLSLDQIVIAAPDQSFKTPKAGFFRAVGFSIQRFINSFSEETNSVVSSTDTSLPTIKIWVNWGRDQVKVLNTLIQDSFTPEKKINVRVEQVNASLVQGLISGSAPDLYLHQSRTEPVNLAMRGVLYNLKNFDDYEEVLKNFQPGAETPYLYRDGCYAIPDQQSFFTMFYRTDILEEMEIEVPKTWDEFLSATGILQRNNMNVYLPYTKITAATTVNTGAGGLSIFPAILMQYGGNIYTEDQKETALGKFESIKAFTFWTDFYTKYSLDQEANFFQKFRVGVYPLGIAGYTTYQQLKVTAPEIEGRWKMAEMPGVLRADGTIDNTCAGSGSGCTIMKGSKDKASAWEFLKWWVSADTQYRYSAELEAILGDTGRQITSNVKAINMLSWDTEALDVINKQWSKVKEIPEVPGSYYVSRSIDQAFWAVKNKKASAKEAIVDWAEISDKEIARKLAEYADLDPDKE